MKETNALTLLAKVMGWEDDAVVQYIPSLMLLADYKYDSYQRFSPGKRFIESLALWLNQFEENDRQVALSMVMDKLIFISESEILHLVQMAYRDIISQERIRLVAEESGIPDYNVEKIIRSHRFNELKLKSLYLGLSDGARTSELRRSSDIDNEQIWQAYELGVSKSEDMVNELANRLSDADLNTENARFNIVWLLDDFSGSGYSYIRYDAESKKWKGKIKKIYKMLNTGQLVDKTHYEIYLLLYVATRQAIDHIEYWSERFTSEYGYKPIKVRVINILELDLKLDINKTSKIHQVISKDKYYDKRANDKHIGVGGTNDAKWGFASCALPLILSHNTPNNSIYILWGPEGMDFFGLFPRVSRHREF